MVMVRYGGCRNGDFRWGKYSWGNVRKGKRSTLPVTAAAAAASYHVD